MPRPSAASFREEQRVLAQVKAAVELAHTTTSNGPSTLPKPPSAEAKAHRRPIPPPRLHLQAQGNYQAMVELFGTKDELTAPLDPPPVTVPFDMFVSVQDRLRHHQQQHEELSAANLTLVQRTAKMQNETNEARARAQSLSDANTALTQRVNQLMLLNDELKRARDQRTAQTRKLHDEVSAWQEKAKLNAQTLVAVHKTVDDLKVAVDVKDRSLHAMAAARDSLRAANEDLKRRVVTAFQAQVRNISRPGVEGGLVGSLRVDPGEASANGALRELRRSVRDRWPPRPRPEVEGDWMEIPSEEERERLLEHFETLAHLTAESKRSAVACLRCRLESTERCAMDLEDQLSAAAEALVRNAALPPSMLRRLAGEGARGAAQQRRQSDASLVALARAEEKLLDSIPKEYLDGPPPGVDPESSLAVAWLPFQEGTRATYRAMSMTLDTFERFQASFGASLSIKELESRWREVMPRWRADCIQATNIAVQQIRSAFEAIGKLDTLRVAGGNSRGEGRRRSSVSGAELAQRLSPSFAPGAVRTIARSTQRREASAQTVGLLTPPGGASRPSAVLDAHSRTVNRGVQTEGGKSSDTGGPPTSATHVPVTTTPTVLRGSSVVPPMHAESNIPATSRPMGRSTRTNPFANVGTSSSRDARRRSARNAEVAGPLAGNRSRRRGSSVLTDSGNAPQDDLPSRRRRRSGRATFASSGKEDGAARSRRSRSNGESSTDGQESSTDRRSGPQDRRRSRRSARLGASSRNDRGPAENEGDAGGQPRAELLRRNAALQRRVLELESALETSRSRLETAVPGGSDRPLGRAPSPQLRLGTAPLQLTAFHLQSPVLSPRCSSAATFEDPSCNAGGGGRGTPEWCHNALIPPETIRGDALALYTYLPEKWFEFHDVLHQFLVETRRRLRITTPIADPAAFIGDGSQKTVADVHCGIRFDLEALKALLALWRAQGRAGMVMGQDALQQAKAYHASVQRLRLHVVDQRCVDAAVLSKLSIADRTELHRYRMDKARIAERLVQRAVNPGAHASDPQAVVGGALGAVLDDRGPGTESSAIVVELERQDAVAEPLLTVHEEAPSACPRADGAAAGPSTDTPRTTVRGASTTQGDSLPRIVTSRLTSEDSGPSNVRHASPRRPSRIHRTAGLPPALTGATVNPTKTGDRAPPSGLSTATTTLPAIHRPSPRNLASGAGGVMNDAKAAAGAAVGGGQEHTPLSQQLPARASPSSSPTGRSAREFSRSLMRLGGREQPTGLASSYRPAEGGTPLNGLDGVSVGRQPNPPS